MPLGGFPWRRAAKRLNGVGIRTGAMGWQVSNQPDAGRRKSLGKFANQIAARKPAGIFTNDLVVGGIRRAIEPRPLPEGEDQVRSPDILELLDKPRKIKSVHAPVPLLDRDIGRLMGTGWNAEKMDHHPPAGVPHPVGVGSFPGWLICVFIGHNLEF